MNNKLSNKLKKMLMAFLITGVVAGSGYGFAENFGEYKERMNYTGNYELVDYLNNGSMVIENEVIDPENDYYNFENYLKLLKRINYRDYSSTKFYYVCEEEMKDFSGNSGYTVLDKIEKVNGREIEDFLVGVFHEKLIKASKYKEASADIKWELKEIVDMEGLIPDEVFSEADGIENIKKLNKEIETNEKEAFDSLKASIINRKYKEAESIILNNQYARRELDVENEHMVSEFVKILAVDKNLSNYNKFRNIPREIEYLVNGFGFRENIDGRDIEQAWYIYSSLGVVDKIDEYDFQEIFNETADSMNDDQYTVIEYLRAGLDNYNKSKKPDILDDAVKEIKNATLDDIESKIEENRKVLIIDPYYYNDLLNKEIVNSKMVNIADIDIYSIRKVFDKESLDQNQYEFENKENAKQEIEEATLENIEDVLIKYERLFNSSQSKLNTLANKEKLFEEIISMEDKSLEKIYDLVGKAGEMSVEASVDSKEVLDPADITSVPAIEDLPNKISEKPSDEALETPSETPSDTGESKTETEGESEKPSDEALETPSETPSDTSGSKTETEGESEKPSDEALETPSETPSDTGGSKTETDEALETPSETPSDTGESKTETEGESEKPSDEALETPSEIPSDTGESKTETEGESEKSSDEALETPSEIPSDTGESKTETEGESEKSSDEALETPSETPSDTGESKTETEEESEKSSEETTEEPLETSDEGK